MWLLGTADVSREFSVLSVFGCAAYVYVVSNIGYAKYIVKKYCDEDNDDSEGERER